MPRITRRRWAAATTALLLAVSLAGCSDDSGGSTDQAASEPSSSASGSASESSTEPSPTPSETAPPEPELPKAPAAKDTRTGRQAFAEFVVARWGYTLATNDADALLDLSPKAGPCQGCRELRDELRKREKEGWYVDFPGAKVRKVDIAAGDGPRVAVARATIDVPASQSFFEDGEFRNENAARKGATFVVRMRLDGKRYSLLSFRVI